MIENLRKEIDNIDSEMQELFKKRIAISKQIGKYKESKKLPIFDAKREEELITKLKEKYNDEETYEYYERFIKFLLAISKDVQNG